ncbi:MAG: hypothetical protein IPH05_14370 [Flavobacteriales bacterium]|nr:hypothetical protein [Flavobacteriales bacterium]
MRHCAFCLTPYVHEDHLDIPDYSPDRGLQYTWVDGFTIHVSVADGEVLIEANEAEAELWFNVLEG